MGEPLDAVAYLARSENRVAILRAVDEGPLDRRDLERAVGVSRSTLSRVLRELEEERGWIRRTDEGGFRSTRAGSLVLDRFVPLLETVGGLQTLGEGMAHLPVEAMDVDVRHFHDAELVEPTELDPTAAFEYGVGRMRASDTIRSVSRTVPPPYVRALHEEVTEGGSTAEIVLDPEYLDAVRDTELAALWHEVARTEDIRTADERLPFRMLVFEDVVHHWLCSDDGDQVGLLESGNPTVREWAEGTVDRYLADGEPVDARLTASG